MILSPPRVSSVSGEAAKRSRAWTALDWVVGIPARGLIALVRLYQRFISPALPAFFGSACGCRFTPSCSHYSIEALRTHGAIVGIVLTAIRLVKCTPLHPGGFDPVPARRRFRCRRIVG